jgi:hypothetical protein
MVNLENPEGKLSGKTPEVHGPVGALVDRYHELLGSDSTSPEHYRELTRLLEEIEHRSLVRSEFELDLDQLRRGAEHNRKISKGRDTSSVLDLIASAQSIRADWLQHHNYFGAALEFSNSETVRVGLAYNKSIAALGPASLAYTGVGTRGVINDCAPANVMEVATALSRHLTGDAVFQCFMGRFEPIARTQKELFDRLLDGSAEREVRFAERNLILALKSAFMDRAPEPQRLNLGVCSAEQKYRWDNGYVEATLPAAFNAYSAVAIDGNLVQWIGQENLPEFFQQILESEFEPACFEESLLLKFTRGDVDKLEILPSIDCNGQLEGTAVILVTTTLSGQPSTLLTRVPLNRDIVPADLDIDRSARKVIGDFYWTILPSLRRDRSF